MTNERIEKAVQRAIKKMKGEGSFEALLLAAEMVKLVAIDLFGENAGKKEGD